MQAGEASAESREIEAEIAALDRRRPLPRPRPHGLASRLRFPLAFLFATPALHRLLPDRVALFLARAVGRLRWMVSGRARERAIAQVSLTLAGSGSREEVGHVARRQVEFRSVWHELVWRPWMYRRAECVGAEHLHAARAHGRGVILTTVHVGFLPALHGVCPEVRPVYVSAGDWLLSETIAGFPGLSARARYRRGFDAGFRYVRSGGSFALLLSLLERGEVCLVVLDVPGRMETRMAGKRAWLAGGAARLSVATGAPVVPLFVDPGVPIRYRILPALDPAGFDDASALLDRLAELAGREILERPHQLEPNGSAPAVWREDAEPYAHAFRRWERPQRPD